MPLTEARTNLSDTPRGEKKNGVVTGPACHQNKPTTNTTPCEHKKKHLNRKTSTAYDPPRPNPTRNKSGNSLNTGEHDRYTLIASITSIGSKKTGSPLPNIYESQHQQKIPLTTEPNTKHCK
ncbi:unnamed protein product, partial [Meganyctiphanes norvegica]